MGYKLTKAEINCLGSFPFLRESFEKEDGRRTEEMILPFLSTKVDTFP